jgi:dCTP deaminase
MLEGRSSIGRLGIKIHITAGFGDIGFNGRWTLEIECTQPTYLYPNMRIGQIFFHEASSNEFLYVGKYQNSEGIEMSKLIKDFS